MTKDILLNGIRLAIKHIIVDNERPTVVFLHDSLGCIKLWRDFPEKLCNATNCNVLVYDRQGYGQSDPFNDEERLPDYMEKEADTLTQLLIKLDIKKAILFGHSDGGSIALIAAGKYPEFIIGIITEGAHIFVEDISLEGIRTTIVAYETTNLKERLEKYHGDKAKGVFWAWANTWLKAEFRTWNIESFLPKITCPVLVIQGEDDEFGSLAQVDGIVNQVSGKSDKLVISAVGHNPHKEVPDQVIQKIIGSFHSTDFADSNQDLGIRHLTSQSIL